MSTVVITVQTPKDPTQFNKAGQGQDNLVRLINLLSGFACGAFDRGAVFVQGSTSDPVAAAATVTITHANVTNADTVTIANTVITAATSGNGTTSWTIGADATADAVAMAACINANTTLNKQLVATSALGVVTLTALPKGVIGNGLGLATSDATAFALVAFAGGTGGAAQSAVQVR